MQDWAGFRPSRAYEELGRNAPDAPGAPFWDRVVPAVFPRSLVRFRNQRWAERIGLGGLDEAGWIARFARFEPLPGASPAPLAMRYHGHQFRAYNPDIGDGRGFLYAQCYDNAGRLLDLATKGSGRTPYSRFGDGRLTLKGGVREALAAEMLEALGVYTSKAFSLVETGEALDRHDEPSPTRSSVLVRLGHSHVRFGVFQRLAAEGDRDAIAALVDYCVTHFDPDLAGFPTDAKAAQFFERVVIRSARLCASWMAAGFVHGVLNTDNMNVTGESFDYGPWRFLPKVDPAFTAAYFDHSGLYAYGRQAEATAWNLSRFGGTLLDLAEASALNVSLERFGAFYEAALGDAFLARLGLVAPADSAGGFVGALLTAMEATGAPFEQTLFDWFGGPASRDRRAASPEAGRYREPAFSDVASILEGLQPERPERLNAAYFERSRPLTMLIDEMEALWAPIAQSDDWAPFDAAIEAIRAMGAAYDLPASANRTDAIGPPTA